MFEESMSILPEIWSSMNSWFTPTVLFVLLNLMIGTIAVSSGLISHKKQQQDPQQQQQQQQDPQQQQLTRYPSVLQRLKSINLYNYRSPEPSTTEKTQILDYNPLQQSHQEAEFILTHEGKEDEKETHVEETQEDEAHEKEDDQFGDKSFHEVYSKLQAGSHFNRTKSEPASVEVVTKLPKKIMKRSASAKSTFRRFEVNDDISVESWRPATTRERKARDVEVEGSDDEEVDAKADDFINRFKQQLKLQKLDSFNRNKQEEMLVKGSGKQ